LLKIDNLMPLKPNLYWVKTNPGVLAVRVTSTALAVAYFREYVNSFGYMLAHTNAPYYYASFYSLLSIVLLWGATTRIGKKIKILALTGLFPSLFFGVMMAGSYHNLWALWTLGIHIYSVKILFKKD